MLGCKGFTSIILSFLTKDKMIDETDKEKQFKAFAFLLALALREFSIFRSI